jgi:hypothetical protein
MDVGLKTGGLLWCRRESYEGQRDGRDLAGAKGDAQRPEKQDCGKGAPRWKRRSLASLGDE